MGEITDVWQPRRMVCLRATVVVMMRLVGYLMVKNAGGQADGG